MSNIILTGNGWQLPLHQPKFTTYEKKLLNLIYDGLSNSQLAKQLGTSVKAIEKSRTILFRKAQVTSIVPMVRFALYNKLIIDPLIQPQQ